MILKICLCLSHKITEEGVLSNDAKSRIETASKIFKSEECNFFITTGWRNHKKLKFSIADFMAKEANLKFKIPSKKIIKETKAKDTVGEALFTKLLIHRNFNFEELIIHIVTSDWHQMRAMEIFNFIYAEENTELVFTAIKGSEEEANKEVENNSIKKFRKLITNCKPGDTKEIYKLLNKEHKLYAKA